MLRTAVPEAPVDEYGDHRPGEQDIGPPASVERQGVVDAVAETPRVESPAQREFRTGVTTPVRTHRRPGRLGGRGRVLHRTSGDA